MSGVLIIGLPIGLTVLVAVLLPAACVDRWLGWISTAIFVLVLVGAIYLAGREKRRSGT